MAELEEGKMLYDIGDHAHYGTSEDDLLAEYAFDPMGYTPVFSTVWSGPYLAALGAFPDISDRALEAKIWHPKGLLPTSILRPEKAKLMEMDPWLRELVCRIHLVNEKPKDGIYTYFAKVFMKFPDTSNQTEEPTRDGPRPLIEANNIRVDFENCPVVDTNGVRGHARGLVTKALLERLDGTEHFGAHKVDTVRRPQIEFHVYPSAPGFKLPADFLPPQLHGIHADCVDALRDAIFGTAKELERKLRNTNDTSRPSRSLQRRGKPKTLSAKKDGHPDKRPDKRPDKQPDRLVFSGQVNLIPGDDKESSTDGNLCGKTSPDADTTPSRLYEIAVRLSDTESVDTELQNSKTVTPDVSASACDKAKPSKKSCGKTIRSFLARMFCCAPKPRRKYSD